jgi:hypothetical protein
LIDKPVVCCAWRGAVSITVAPLLLLLQLLFTQIALAEAFFDTSGRASVFFRLTQEEYDTSRLQE